ncbi:MAG: hypothetical protein GY928_08115 [Colwellia sp.]|nr:hypothetical protein [Colwellia sp.]
MKVFVADVKGLKGDLYGHEYMDRKQLSILFGCLQYVCRSWFDRGLEHITRKGVQYAKLDDVCEFIALGLA